MTEKITIPAEEAETVINFSKGQIGDWAEVYTTDKPVMKRFEKFVTKHPDYGRLLKEDKYSMTFSVHPKSASLYPKAPRTVVMTEERKQALADRLREARNRNNA